MIFFVYLLCYIRYHCNILQHTDIDRFLYNMVPAGATISESLDIPLYHKEIRYY